MEEKQNTLKFEKGSSKQRHLNAHTEMRRSVSTIAALHRELTRMGCLCTSENGELERGRAGMSLATCKGECRIV